MQERLQGTRKKRPAGSNGDGIPGQLGRGESRWARGEEDVQAEAANAMESG